MPTENTPNPESSENRSNLSYAVASVPSERHPDRNEDDFVINPDSNNFAVLDGVSSASNGQLAAHLASEKLKAMPDLNSPNLSSEEILKCIVEYLQDADKLLASSSDRTGETLQTTATVAHIREEGGAYELIVGYVGDSRVYCFDHDTLKQLTIDDSNIKGIYFDEGTQRRIQEKLNNTVDLQTLSAEEMSIFRTRNAITQCLGMDGIRPNVARALLQKDQIILLTTDGIHDNLTDNEIEDCVKRGNSPDEIKDLIIKAAVSRSQDRQNPRSKKDDMTVIVVKLGEPKISKKIIAAEAQNRPELPSEGKERNNRLDIASSNNFDELFVALKHIRGIQGSEEFYPSEYLISVISNIRLGKGSADEVTRQLGLRQKVQDLLKIEQSLAEISRADKDGYAAGRVYPSENTTDDIVAGGSLPAEDSTKKTDQDTSEEKRNQLHTQINQVIQGWSRINKMPRDDQRAYALQLEGDLPQIDDAVMSSYGIPEMQGQKNIEAMQKFRKEDKYPINENFFQIIRDPSGKDWLLKTSPLSWRPDNDDWMLQLSYTPSKQLTPKKTRFRVLQGLQGEVFASRLADNINYPVPESRLVRYLGRPWVAYEYFEGATEGSDLDTIRQISAIKERVKNYKDVLVRPLFNVLADTGGDGSFQAIIINRYYCAQDLGIGPGKINMSSEEVLSELTNEKRSEYGMLIEPDSDDCRKAIDDFIQEIRHLENHTIASIFSDYIGPESEKDSIIKMIKNRRNLLLKLYEK